MTTTVCVELLADGTRVWRPVAAQHVSENSYRLIGRQPEGEVWPFAEGDVVRCELRTLSGGATLVAYEKVN